MMDRETRMRQLGGEYGRDASIMEIRDGMESVLRNLKDANEYNLKVNRMLQLVVWILGATVLLQMAGLLVRMLAK